MRKKMWMSNNMAKTLACVVMLGMLSLAGRFGASAQQPAGATSASPELIAPPLKIGSGDLITVTIFDSPELSGRFRIDEKGDIDAPLLGPVHVQDLTVEQASELMEKLYVEAEILKPKRLSVAVFIEEYTNQRLTVGGEVRNPGLYPALGIRTINDVLTAAGGVTQAAASKVIITRRSDPKNPLTVDYNPEALNPVIPQVQIFPGDSILVPRAGIVYVVGNVNKPGVYVLDGRNVLTVEEVMGLAGGGGHAAKLSHAQLVRALPDGRKEMTIIAVNKIFKGQSPDVALKDGDILYVPTSTGKLVTEQAIITGIGIGTSLALYRVASQ
jgi:polysaccharide export outer membrane protein